jgi:tetratricopeptide (TPR) repeat protein
VHVTVGDHVAALQAFEAARPLAATTALNYLSHFLGARSLELLNRHDEAIAEYQSALAIVPLAESATVALASLQFLRGEHDASVALIDKAFATTSTTTDPGRLTGYGFYLHWPEIKAAMRAELKQ